MTKLSLKPAGVGSVPPAGPHVAEPPSPADAERWTLQEEHYDSQGVLEHWNAEILGSRAELEAELSRLDLSNMDRQRLLDGETVTLWE
jgi:hypothetical protein